MQSKDDVQVRWWQLEEKLTTLFGKKPDMEAILFLIGVQETGKTNQSFTKEQKQDLMHVAVCTLLMPNGYYKYENLDAEGWPHFTQLKDLPVMDAVQQAQFLKDYILLYFQERGL